MAASIWQVEQESELFRAIHGGQWGWVPLFGLLSVMNQEAGLHNQEGVCGRLSPDQSEKGKRRLSQSEHSHPLPR